jgi:hypothetical protein
MCTEKEVKPSLFVEGILVYTGNPKASTEKLQQLISDFRILPETRCDISHFPKMATTISSIPHALLLCDLASCMNRWRLALPLQFG